MYWLSSAELQDHSRPVHYAVHRWCTWLSDREQMVFCVGSEKQILPGENVWGRQAFICPLGFFQFGRMPQGITGAPTTFQRLMEKAIGDMNLIQVFVYFDDLIVFGKPLEEHEERLLKVLDWLEECGLKISIDKCQFCQPLVKFLWHCFCLLCAVTHWKKPTDLKSLRSFLGFCGYYRQFIENYSAIVRPLTELTKGYPPAQRKKQTSCAIGVTRTSCLWRL